MTTELKGDWGYTNDPLDNGLEYKTPGILCQDNKRLRGTLITDQDGKLYIEQGPTQEFKDDHSEETAISKGVALSFDVACIGLWCRIRVLNDSGFNQTYLRLGWKLTD